jgi:hypothetical protein
MDNKPELFGDSVVTLSGDEFVGAITPVVDYTAKEETRYNLNVIQVTREGNMVRFEATNGHAASRVRLKLGEYLPRDYDNTKGSKCSVVVTPTQVDKVFRLLKAPGKGKKNDSRIVTIYEPGYAGGVGVIEVMYGDGCQVYVDAGRESGRFPDLDLVIPPREGKRPNVCLLSSLLNVVDRVKEIKPKHPAGYLTVFDFSDKYAVVDRGSEKPLAVAVKIQESRPDDPKQAVKYYETVQLSELGSWLPSGPFGVQQKYLLPGLKAMDQTESEVGLWFDDKGGPMVIANLEETPVGEHGSFAEIELVVMPVKM